MVLRSFLHQSRALLYAKAMLLVRDDKAQVFVFHAF